MNGGGSKITIVLAEDHHLVRQGLRLVLEQQPDFQLVGEAADGLEATQLVEKLKPKVLVCDLFIPRVHGLEVVRQVRRDCPDTKVVILSMHKDECHVKEALRYGAMAYVLKESTSAELVQAIRNALAGRRYLSPDLQEIALSGFAEPPEKRGLDIYETLTDRERLVLQLAADGATSPLIGKKLFISPRTAETHRANLMRKLGLRSQTDLVRFAIRRKIIAV